MSTCKDNSYHGVRGEADNDTVHQGKGLLPLYKRQGLNKWSSGFLWVRYFCYVLHFVVIHFDALQTCTSYMCQSDLIRKYAAEYQFYEASIDKRKALDITFS